MIVYTSSILLHIKLKTVRYRVCFLTPHNTLGWKPVTREAHQLKLSIYQDAGHGPYILRNKCQGPIS